MPGRVVAGPLSKSYGIYACEKLLPPTTRAALLFYVHFLPRGRHRWREVFQKIKFSCHLAHLAGARCPSFKYNNQKNAPREPMVPPGPFLLAAARGRRHWLCDGARPPPFSLYPARFDQNASTAPLQSWVVSSERSRGVCRKRLRRHALVRRWSKAVGGNLSR